MSQVRRYIFIAAVVLFVTALIAVGHYVYAGKGWLLIERKESVADFYFNRGLYYFNGGAYNLEAARQGFEEALAHSNGAYPFAYYQLGRIYFIQGDFSSALIEEDKELALYSTNNKAHYMKGLIYGYRKQYIQAESEFKTYVENVPNAWAGYNDLAWIYFAEGSYVDAADIAKQGLAHAPDNSWLQNSYAVAELNLGNFSVAEKYLLMALATFAKMNGSDWGRAYPGNSSSQYDAGLEQVRTAIAQNLTLVHSKLNDAGAQ